MHRLNSSSTLRRYRLVSIFFVLRWLLVLAAAGFMGWGFFYGERERFMLGLGLLGLGVLFLIIGFVLSTSLKCPLCMMPPFLNRGCSKNAKSKKIFGSYSLRVSLTILGKGSFQCPYCNESTVMAVRDKCK